MVSSQRKKGRKKESNTYFIVARFFTGHLRHESASKGCVDKVCEIGVPAHPISLCGVAKCVTHCAQLAVGLFQLFDCQVRLLESDF